MRVQIADMKTDSEQLVVRLTARVSRGDCQRSLTDMTDFLHPRLLILKTVDIKQPPRESAGRSTTQREKEANTIMRVNCIVL